MFKKIGYTLYCLLLYISCMAQSPHDLFYFLSADSLMGVKDDEGRVVIPAKHLPWGISQDDLSERITDHILILVPKGSHLRNTYGVAYSREGLPLYEPYLFDNGPDYIEGGLSRYVENGKIGFVDRDGKKVIPAYWDWAGNFECGIAMVCTHCEFDYSKDTEHPSLNLSKAEVACINKQGKVISPLKHRLNPKDILLNGQYFPYPFIVSKQEKHLLEPLNYFCKRMSKAYFVNMYSPLSLAERTLHYEIVERPSSHFPYHIIQAFYRTEIGEYRKADLTFCADARGEVYFLPYDQNMDSKLPLTDWFMSYEADARHYSKEHADAPYRYR